MLENPPRCGKLFAGCAIALLVGYSSHAVAIVDDDAAYTDKIYLTNGDTITGNIKELDRGKMRLKTLTMDTVYINWVDIESIESDKYLRIERIDGSFNYGLIKKSDLSEELVVQDHGQDVEVPVIEISTIKPIRIQESFWRRIEGDLSAGINFTKASDILVTNLSSNLRFREEKYEIGFSANWNETSRTEDNNSSRANITGTYTRLRKGRRFWQGSGAFERNQELGIDLRTIATATIGKYFVQTPIFRFEVNGGLAATWEDRQDNTTIASAEGVLRSSFDIFKLNVPMTSLTANVEVFPGITESGRIRANTRLNFRNELIRDMFWDLTFYSTYDNQPAEGAEREDYGIITSIGASF